MKTYIVSDWHLGSKYCRKDSILDFLKKFDGECLILNGDIIDCYALSKNHFKYWDQKCWTIIQKILRLSRKNVKIIYVKGNHEIDMNFLMGEQAGNIEFVQEYKIQNAWIIHGDLFDSSIAIYSGLLMKLGSFGYNVLLELAELQNKFFPNTKSISHKIKSNVKSIVSYINEFENLAAIHAKKHNAEILIMGHTHVAKDVETQGIRYINSGCWLNDSKPNYILFDGNEFFLLDF